MDVVVVVVNYDGATDFELRKGLKFGGRKNMKTERNEMKRCDVRETLELEWNGNKSVCATYHSIDKEITENMRNTFIFCCSKLSSYAFAMPHPDPDPNPLPSRFS